MVQMRVVTAPSDTDEVLALLERAPGVVSVIVQRGAAVVPKGDVVLADVSDEVASLIVGDLRTLGVSERGVIDVERLDASVSTRGVAIDAQVAGRPADAILWHTVGERIAAQGMLSLGMLALFALAGMIAGVAVLIDSAPIVVGAMAVSPDLGPITAFAARITQRRVTVARAGLAALLAGFGIAVVASFVVTALLIATGIAPPDFAREGNTLAEAIAAPDWYSVIVALLAGAAGMISVVLLNSGALVGVAISITTIPAAADVGLSMAYREWSSAVGSGIQLALNLIGLLISSTLVLALLRRHMDRRIAADRETVGLGSVLGGPLPVDDALEAAAVPPDPAPRRTERRL